MSEVTTTAADRTANIELVERWISTFDDRWPTSLDLAVLLTPDVRFVEHPNLVSANGGERDLAGMAAGIEAGKSMLAWQRFEPISHVVEGSTVVSRIKWSGEIKVDAGPWPAGTKLTAWCVAHYSIEGGRIARIEQHDCYEQPVLP